MKNFKNEIFAACGVCATMAARSVAKYALYRVRNTGGLVVRTGCDILEWYAGIKVGLEVVGFMNGVYKSFYKEEEIDEDKSA